VRTMLCERSRELVSGCTTTFFIPSNEAASKKPEQLGHLGVSKDWRAWRHASPRLRSHHDQEFVVLLLVEEMASPSPDIRRGRRRQRLARHRSERSFRYSRSSRCGASTPNA
jgi:hypothetical protein